jgi:hypothetical protein
VLTIGQNEIQEWWKRHEKYKELKEHTKEEVKDLTSCVPLLLNSTIRNGETVDLAAAELVDVSTQVQQFVNSIEVESTGERPGEVSFASVGRMGQCVDSAYVVLLATLWKGFSDVTAGTLHLSITPGSSICTLSSATR